MIRKFLLLNLLLLLDISVFSQSKARDEREFNFDVSAGYMFRTTIFYNTRPEGLFIPGRLDPGLPYSYKKGINGTGLNLSGTLISNSIKLGIKYTGTIRYDFLRFSDQGNDHSFYYDHNFSIMRYLKFKNVMNEKPKYVGVGYSIVNKGSSFNYDRYIGPDLPLEDTRFGLEFDAYRIFVGIPVWKLYLEPGIYIVPDDFPGPAKDSATLFYLEAMYVIRIF